MERERERESSVWHRQRLCSHIYTILLNWKLFVWGIICAFWEVIYALLILQQVLLHPYCFRFDFQHCIWKCLGHFHIWIIILYSKWTLQSAIDSWSSSLFLARDTYTKTIIFTIVLLTQLLGKKMFEIREKIDLYLLDEQQMQRQQKWFHP